MADKKTGVFPMAAGLQVAKVRLTAGVAGANNISWPITFTAAPQVAVTQETSSTASYGVGLQGITTTGATVNLSTGGTFDILAVYHP